MDCVICFCIQRTSGCRSISQAMFWSWKRCNLYFDHENGRNPDSNQPSCLLYELLSFHTLSQISVVGKNTQVPLRSRSSSASLLARRATRKSLLSCLSNALVKTSILAAPLPNSLFQEWQKSSELWWGANARLTKRGEPTYQFQKIADRGQLPEWVAYIRNTYIPEPIIFLFLM